MHVLISSCACLSFCAWHCTMTGILLWCIQFFINWTVNKELTRCKQIYWSHMGYIWSLNNDLFRHSVIYIYQNLFKQELFVFYCNKMNKEETIFYFIYWVDLEYIWSLNIDLSRHLVLSISLRSIQFLTVSPVNKSETMC